MERVTHPSDTARARRRRRTAAVDLAVSLVATAAGVLTPVIAVVEVDRDGTLTGAEAALIAFTMIIAVGTLVALAAAAEAFIEAVHQ